MRTAKLQYSDADSFVESSLLDGTLDNRKDIVEAVVA